MKPTDLHLFRSYGRPAVTADGDVFAALATPDLAADRYRSTVQLACPGAAPIDFTVGPRDSAPVLSPDGELLVFLRGGESGPAQPYAMRVAGGEPWPLASHPLGVSAVTFSPDGRAIAYLAPVPEPGRYGTPPAEEGDAAEASAGAPSAAAAPESEAPRRIGVMSYRSDGKGFVLDKPEQVFYLPVRDESGAVVRDAAARQLTAELGPIGRPAFTPDGRDLVYARRSAPDSLRGEIAAVAVDLTEPGEGRLIVVAEGDAAMPVVGCAVGDYPVGDYPAGGTTAGDTKAGGIPAGDTVYFVGAAYQGNGFAGQTNGLWAAPLAGGTPRRVTDPKTVHIDPVAGEPLLHGNDVLIAVANRGAVEVRAISRGAVAAALDELPVLLGGKRAVKSFGVNGNHLAAVVATTTSTGDLVTVDLDPAPDAAEAETALTDVSAPLRDAGLGPVVELTGTAPDGHPVHGWLVLPPESDLESQHPVLLAVHGGPHAAYTWGVFDEAQMYATNGYAVVLPNPRGSSGYGLDHGAAIVGKLGTIDADDVLALLDAALERPDLDAHRVGVMGGSYGGFMTSWLASHAPQRFVAGISERAVNAWDSFTGASDIGYFFADGYVGSNRDEQWAKSPLAHADRIGIPLLIIHSEQDWRCPLEQAQRLFVALKLRGHETEMLVFPGEGHELSRSGRPQHRRQRFEAILDWWRRYLPVG